MNCTTIGLIHSPHREIGNMPIQAAGARGIQGSIDVHPDYTDGLRDLDGFSNIIILYHFHLSEGFSLTVKPFMDEVSRGVFATRAPRRPNSIGISILRLTGIDGTTLHVEDVDVVDGTPLLDIKPFVPAFDNREDARIGWLASRVDALNRTRSDDRFR